MEIEGKLSEKCYWNKMQGHFSQLLTTAFYALSYGNLCFALHGSFINHFLISQNSQTANQNLRK